MSFEVGSRVETDKNGKGKVAFVGTTKFADGEWIGVILDEPKGKNNGTVQEVQYFTCEDKYGLFVRATQLKMEGSGMKTRSSASALRQPTSSLKDVSKSARPSPKTSPRISPAVSSEKLQKTGTTRKMSSTSKLADPSEKRKPGLNQSSLSKTQRQKSPSVTPKLSRESSALSRETSSVTAAKVSKPSVTSAPPEKEPETKVEAPTENVLSRVKKMEETTVAPPSPVHVPAGLDELTKIEYLEVENSDLKEKLDTLRMKRKEDVAKLQEFERTKVQMQSLLELKTRLTDQNMDLIKQLEEAKRESSDIRAWLDAHHEDMKSATEQQEMLLIDKELAEEKLDQMEAENEALKTELDLVKGELALLQDEMTSGGTGSVEGNSVQLKNLEQQLDKMKEVCIKLRDLHSQAVADKSDIEKELELIREENSELITAAELAQKRAHDADERIIDFQEQMEAAMGAEEMILVLTSKNGDMEEKILSLEEKLEEMEALRDMDEQINEAQKEQSKDLMKDIAMHEMKYNELVARLNEEEKHSNDLMATIMKFRQRCCKLDEEIQDLKDQLLAYEEKLSGDQSEEKNMASMVSQLQLNAGKAFAESVERQNGLIELEYCRKQIGYLKAFLPDNFTKAGGDNDSVIMNILFPRLIAKANLFTKLAVERFPGVPGGPRREHVTKSHKAEQWAHVARVSSICSALIAVCGQFESALQTMTVESLARISQLQPDMMTHEKTIDSFIDLLKQGRFDENTSLDNLNKAVMYFENVFSVNVGSDAFNVPQWVSAVLANMGSSLSWSKVNTQRISYFLLPNSEGSDVQELVVRLESNLDKCQQFVMRAQKRIPADLNLKLSSQFSDDLQSVVSNLEKFGSILHEACGIASVQININPDLDGFEPSRIKEIIHGVVEKFAGSITLEKAYDPIIKLVQGFTHSLEQIATALDGGLMEEPINVDKKTFPPMLERAHQRKQAAAEAEGLRWQLEKKDNEILELKKNIKSRIDDISNMKLRLDMAEARMDSSGKQESEKIQLLEASKNEMAAELKKKTIEFEEEIDKLRSSVAELEKDNAQLRRSHSSNAKTQLFQSIQSMEAKAAGNTPSNGPAVSTIGKAELGLLELQLSETQASLKSVTLDNIRLKNEIASLSAPGGVLRVPKVVSGIETLRANSSDSVFELISKEAEQLRREESKYLFHVPDYSLPLRTREEQRIEFEQQQENFYYRVDVLRARLRTYWSTTHPGQPFPKNIINIGNGPSSTKVPSSCSQMQVKDVFQRWGLQVN